MSTPTPIQKAPSARWSLPIIVVHWATALVVLSAFALVIGREFGDDKTVRQAMLQWHRMAGITAWLFLLVRIPLRLSSSKPDHGFSKPMRMVAAAGHGFLYLALLATPLLGYLLTCARTGHVEFAGIVLPALIERDRDLAESLESVHSLVGWLMLAMIGLHALIAIWHHRIARDQVLSAMLPGRLLH
jgi:cytochrome b561